MAEKIVITCACTGAETTKAQNPALPCTAEEIAFAAHEAYLAGASVLHMHVRDANGKATQNAEVFKKAIDLVRAKCDIVIETTTGGAVGDTPEERLQPLTLNPEMASLDCGTVNFGNEFIVNTLPIMREFASQMRERKIRPTLECFDLGHVFSSLMLLKEGLIEAPLHYGFVLNVPGAVPYSPEALDYFVRQLPEGAHWTCMGIGRASLPAQFGAIARGGWLRVGFEDNVYYSKGVLAKSNAELVERAVRLVKESGAEVATSADVRQMLKLRT